MGYSVNIKCYFKVLEWAVYIGFCILAAFFMNDVIDQYQAKETYLGKSLTPITKLPTITFCIDHEHQFKINDDLIISYHNQEIHDESILQERILTQFGREYLQLNQVAPNCFKINSTSTLPIAVRRFARNIEVTTYGKAQPRQFYVWFTSEANHYGYYNDEFFEGKEFLQKVLPGERIVLTFHSIEYIYREQESNCTYETFLHQWKPYLQKIDFSQCPEKCSGGHGLVDLSSLPICSNKESAECVNDLIDTNYEEFASSDNYKRPCETLEYAGTVYDVSTIPEETRNESTSIFQMNYKFSTPELTTEYKEHLVFDTVNMIGSVGGTLGMCVGFSFSGIISNTLDLIKSKMV